MYDSPDGVNIHPFRPPTITVTANLHFFEFFCDDPVGAYISLVATNMVDTVMAGMGLQHGVGAPNEGLMKTIRLAQVSAWSVAWASIAIQDDVRGSANESLVKTIHVTQVRVVRCPGVDVK